MTGGFSKSHISHNYLRILSVALVYCIAGISGIRITRME